MTFVRKYLYDWLVKKILGGVVGGVQGWIVSFVFGKVWDKWLRPGLLFLWRKAEMVWRKYANGKKIKKVREAKTVDEASDSFHDLP